MTVGRLVVMNVCSSPTPGVVVTDWVVLDVDIHSLIAFLFVLVCIMD